MGEYRAVILDVDGTLVDSNDAHARAFTEAMAEAGFRVPYERIRRLIGMGSDKLLPEAIGVEKESETGTRIADRKKQILAERYLSSMKPCRGARELVEALRQRGVEMIVASSAGDDELKDLLKAAQVNGLIDKHTSSSDADQSKPEPDIVQAALEKLDADAGETVMVGDTPYDVQAAQKAGVSIIALRCGGWGDDDLRGAIAIYDDPAGLLANLSRHVSAAADAKAQR